MVGVARIHTLLDLCCQLIEWECLLRSLFELVFIFVKLTNDLIHDGETRNLMLEVYSIVFVYVGCRLEQEPDQEVAINLLDNIEELEVAMLGLARKLGVCKSVEEGDKNFLEVRSLLLWVDILMFLKGADVGLG